jgi:hypothetical protein
MGLRGGKISLRASCDSVMSTLYQTTGGEATGFACMMAKFMNDNLVTDSYVAYEARGLIEYRHIHD